MGKFLLLTPFFISASISLIAQTTTSSRQAPVKITPVFLVEQQVKAYNTRNIDAFLAPYADSVELYTFPDKLISKGKEAMRRDYSDFFNKTPDLHCKIKSRIIHGNTVIDQESVTGMGSKPFEGVVIYQIEGKKIKKVYFVD